MQSLSQCSYTDCGCLHFFLLFYCENPPLTMTQLDKYAFGLFHCFLIVCTRIIVIPKYEFKTPKTLGMPKSLIYQNYCLFSVIVLS